MGNNVDSMMVTFNVLSDLTIKQMGQVIAELGPLNEESERLLRSCLNMFNIACDGFRDEVARLTK